MQCSITDGRQYDDDHIEVPTDPQSAEKAKLDAIIEEIARGVSDDDLREFLRKVEPIEPEYMECPYRDCKKISLPMPDGGECTECHREAWF